MATSQIFHNLKTSKYIEMLPHFQKEKSQAFGTIIFSLVIIAFFGIFAISPTVSTIAELQKKIEDNNFVNEQLDKKIANLIALQQQYQQLEKKIALVNNLYPQKPEVTLLTAQVQTIAQQSNITIARLQLLEVELVKKKPGPTQTGRLGQENFNSYAFSFEGFGTYADITQFLANLVAFNRLVTLESVGISVEQENPFPYRVNVRGKAYFKK